MADLYLKDPKTGEVVVFDQADAQAASNAGYQAVDQATLDAARRAETESAGTPGAAVQQGLLQAPADYSPGREFVAKTLSAATFGTLEQDPRSVASARRYGEEHPYAAAGAEILGSAPLALAGGVAGAAVRGAAAGGSLLARAGGIAADYGINAAVSGAQIEGEESRLAAENFSFTDAAIAGVATEALGRGAAWTISKTLGGARNLVTRAARDAVAQDAERTLTKGGWVGDYRTAQHAEVYRDELADLGARDLDTLETATEEVSRQDKKRSRIMRSIVGNAEPQHEINIQAVEGLQRLRGALADELSDAGGPAKRLAKQLDERIAALEQAPKGKKLWRILDENRQALQEYRQDLHQSYDANPGSAWLSREGLAAIDAAEEATRTALLREDAWGTAAAQMQSEYNVPFHEKWFPARQTVLRDLHFATGKNAQGFTTYRGEPGKMRKFLTGLGGAGENTHRLREGFTQYLDGAEAIARAGEVDSPKAAREALESVRRLRKNLNNATAINAAAERTAERGTLASAGATVAGAVVGGAVGGAGGAVLGGAAVRGAKLGTWFGQVAHRFKVFHGTAESMAELLAKDVLPAAKTAGEELSERLTGDILDAPFPVTPSARPLAPVGPIHGEATRGVGVAGPPQPEAIPGIGPGQVGRQDSPRRPAGMEAITPQSVRGVGPEAPVPPARGGGGWETMERPGGPSERPTGADELAPAPRPDGTTGSTRPTRPTPNATEYTAHVEQEMFPGSAARAAEGARMQALTEGEFRHVVEGLRATGQKAPDGSLLGDFLAKHADDLKSAGLIVAGAGATAAAASADSEEGVAGASAGGVALLAAGLGRSRLLGAKFFRNPEAAARIVREAIEELPHPPAMARDPVNFGNIVRGEAPAEVRKLFKVSQAAAKNLDLKEQAAVSEWVGSSSSIRHEQRTGLTRHEAFDPQAPAFESAMDKLTVVDPTKHGVLYRHLDLEDTGLAELLTRDEFVAGAHMSTSYMPDADFGPHQLRFEHVDAAAALLGANPAEMEMVIPKDARFRVTGRYADPETGNFTFVLKEIPETKASALKEVGYLTIPAAGAAALGDEADDGAAGASAGGMGFVGAAALFKQTRGRLVADVARRLFSPTVGRAVARLAARQVYTRADLAKRQAEFQAWQENPQGLVDRVAEGFRDVPPEAQPKTHQGVFAAAAFLKERLPQTTKRNAVSMRDLPVSTEQLVKYTRYEDAALRPREAWTDAAARGHLSTELLETTEALHPDLLAELRVAAYLTVREEGPPVTIQAKTQYARLFDGQGELADPSMSQTVAQMAAMAFEAAVPPKAGGGPTSSGGQSHVAAAVQAPAGLVRVG